MMDYPWSRPLLRGAFFQTWRSGPVTGRLAVHLLVALGVMELLIWFHSGTLGPYSAVATPRELLDCGYTGNTDHGEYVDVYWMLRGLPANLWQGGVVLRRMVYPLLAFPFSVLLGFTIGGFIANLLIHAAALSVWAWFLFATLGRRAAVAGVWLLATWPGIFYWAGLPYSPAVIVPFSALSFILLRGLNERRTILRVFLSCFGIGVMWQAYDSILLFGVAALALLAWRDRRPLALAAGAAGFVLPAVVCAALLLHVFHVPSLGNSNSNIYPTILGAYLKALRGEIPPDAWLAAVSAFFPVLAANFFDSCFTVLPALFLVLMAVNGVYRLVRFDPAEVAVAAVVFGVFAFNNLAPPYEGWAMRGEWIARLYQPVYVVYIFMAARMVKAGLDRGPSARLAVGVPILLAICLDMTVAFGGIVANWSITSLVYHRFYRHAAQDAYHHHLEVYGRRPLGFCVRNGDWPPIIKASE